MKLRRRAVTYATAIRSTSYLFCFRLVAAYDLLRLYLSFLQGRGATRPGLSPLLTTRKRKEMAYCVARFSARLAEAGLAMTAKDSDDNLINLPAVQPVFLRGRKPEPPEDILPWSLLLRAMANYHRGLVRRGRFGRGTGRPPPPPPSPVT